MNEEQMKQMMAQFVAQMGTIVNKAISDYDEKRKKEDEEARKKAEEEAKKKKDEDDALKKAEEEVRRKKEAKTAEELEKERYLDAFKYNSTVQDFLKDNAEYLPESLADIINILQAKTYANDVEKSQELKRAVVEQYIKIQENLDMLPESLKAKAEKYAGFTTKEKLERAPEFYDIVETGIHTAKNIKKAEAIEKSGGLPTKEKDAIQEYEDKMLQFSKDAIAQGAGDGK